MLIRRLLTKNQRCIIRNTPLIIWQIKPKSKMTVLFVLFTVGFFKILRIEHFCLFKVCLSRQELSNEHTMCSVRQLWSFQLNDEGSLTICGPGVGQNLEIEPPFSVSVFLAWQVTVFACQLACPKRRFLWHSNVHTPVCRARLFTVVHHSRLLFQELATEMFLRFYWTDSRLVPPVNLKPGQWFNLHPAIFDRMWKPITFVGMCESSPHFWRV